MLRKELRNENARGGGVFRKEGLPREVLMMQDTYHDLGANKNPIITDSPSAFFFSEYLEREGGEQIDPLI